MGKIKNINLEETFSIAVANHRQNKIKKAQILYNKILEVNLNYLPALNNLGILFNISNEYLKALGSFSEMYQFYIKKN